MDQHGGNSDYDPSASQPPSLEYETHPDWHTGRPESYDDHSLQYAAARFTDGSERIATPLNRSDTFAFTDQPIRPEDIMSAMTGWGPPEFSGGIQSPEHLSGSTLSMVQGTEAGRSGQPLAELPDAHASSSDTLLGRNPDRPTSAGEQSQVSSQPTPEQRARWELLRSLIRPQKAEQKTGGSESAGRTERPSSSPRARSNQFNPDPQPARTPSKTMRTLMLPQMVERRKSTDVGPSEQPRQEPQFLTQAPLSHNRGASDPVQPPLPPRPQPSADHKIGGVPAQAPAPSGTGQSKALVKPSANSGTSTQTPVPVPAQPNRHPVPPKVPLPNVQNTLHPQTPQKNTMPQPTGEPGRPFPLSSAVAKPSTPASQKHTLPLSHSVPHPGQNTRSTSSAPPNIPNKLTAQPPNHTPQKTLATPRAAAAASPPQSSRVSLHPASHPATPSHPSANTSQKVPHTQVTQRNALSPKSTPLRSQPGHNTLTKASNPLGTGISSSLTHRPPPKAVGSLTQNPATSQQMPKSLPPAALPHPPAPQSHPKSPPSQLQTSSQTPTQPKTVTAQPKPTHPPVAALAHPQAHSVNNPSTPSQKVSPLGIVAKPQAPLSLPAKPPHPGQRATAPGTKEPPAHIPLTSHISQPSHPGIHPTPASHPSQASGPIAKNQTVPSAHNPAASHIPATGDSKANHAIPPNHSLASRAPVSHPAAHSATLGHAPPKHPSLASHGQQPNYHPPSGPAPSHPPSGPAPSHSLSGLAPSHPLSGPAPSHPPPAPSPPSYPAAGHAPTSTPPKSKVTPAANHPTEVPVAPPKQPASISHPLAPNQSTADRNDLPNTTQTQTQSQPRSSGSLNRHGAIARRKTPTRTAVNTRRPVPSQRETSPSPRLPQRAAETSNNDQTKEINLSENLCEVLGQLAGGNEPHGEVSLEQEADNLVNLFFYGTALMFKSVMGNVAYNDGWGHIERSMVSPP